VTTTQTPAAATAAAKRETRAALTSAGFAVAKVAASAAYVQVTLADEADVPAVLRTFPNATAPYATSASSTSRRTVLLAR
jgi:hypothetical protein